MPMFLRKARHWVLGYVECKYMTLSVHNSPVNRTFEEELKDLGTEMDTILTHLLKSVGLLFYFKADHRP